MPVAKVYIVEDEAITALDIKRTLEKLNYEIVGIKDRGEDAIDDIAKLSPDAVLMDITLKGELDGIETARLLNIRKKIPVIYLTAHFDDETIDRSKSTNPYGFLLKPLNDRDLNSCLRMALYRFDTENKLNESESRLNAAKKKNLLLFNSLNSTALILNAEGLITSVNRYSEKEKFATTHFLNSDIRKVFPGKTGNKLFQLSEDTLKKGKRNIFKHIIKSGENSYNYETEFLKYSESEVLVIFSELNKVPENEFAVNKSEQKYRNLVKNSPFSITRLLIKTNKYEYVNDEFIRQSGYTLEEFNSLSYDEYFKLIHNDDREKVMNEYTGWIKEGCPGLKNLIYRIKNKNNEDIWLESYHFADKSIDGKIEAVNQVYININKQKKYEEILSESKQYLDAFFQQSFDGIFIAKTEKPVKWNKSKNNENDIEEILNSIRIVRANKPLADQFGTTVSDVLNVSPLEYYGTDIRKVKTRWKKFLDNGYSHISEYFSRADGSKIFIEGDYYCLYDNSKNFTGYLGIQRDMTERQIADEKLKLSEEKFRAVAESMPAQVVIYQDNRFVYANQYSEVITGYKINEILKKNFWDLVHDDYKDLVKERGEKRLKGEYAPENYEFSIVAKDKTEKWLNYSARIINYDGKKAVLGVATDITESRKIRDKIKQSEEKYRNFVNHSSEGIYRLEFRKPVPVNLAVDEQADLLKENVFIAECNRVFAQMYEYDSPDEIMGKNVNYLKYQNPDILSRIMKFIMNDYIIIDDEVSEIDAAGKRKYFIVNIFGVIENELLTSIWGVQREITEKKKSEKELQKSLEEKDILLKEIHHRVKNNLQIVTSLLKLQAGYVKDEKVKQLFRESQNRVQSMSLIHQKLYQTRDLAHIDFREYIETVTVHLQHSYGILEDRVKINTEVSNLVMSIDNAIPAGLIINELVSNSLKHAFPGGRKGNIYINAAYDEYKGEYWLLIRDDGKGIDHGLDINNSDSFGLKLVNTLVKQLAGIIEVVVKGGTEFRIHFKSADYKDRNS
ncbi:MAG: PAS/PAC domain-containing protein [Chlorobi bacterium OLB5]|nr:MAG: PAS/PAC domain-containing protein [Chlorobi bacterium OLB5]